jgi:hypothetical protein
VIALDPGTVMMIQGVGFLDLGIWFVSVGIRAILDRRRALDMVGRSRKVYTILSTYYNTLDYIHRYLDSVLPPLLIYSLTYANTTLAYFA